MTSQQFLILAIAIGLIAILVALLVARRARNRPLTVTPPVTPPLAPPATSPSATPETSEAPPSPSPFLAAPEGAADDLSQIKGIGPKLSARLGELGVFHYRQIAEWTDAQLAMVDAELGNFAGRPARDQWQAQARLLAAGDLKAYERQHGKLTSTPAATPPEQSGPPA